MTVLELFAGAGGVALGLHAAGFEHLECVEWDKDAAATLHAAGLPTWHGDVRDYRRTVDAAPPGLLWSSFPCQGWSMAGKRRGALDERNGWPWTVEAIDRFRPEWFAGENVPGLVTHSKTGHGDPATCPGCYFEGTILPDLRARFAHVQWWILDAADYGVPQRRRRVILVAGPRPARRPEETHSGWWLACEKWITGRYWQERGIEAVGQPSREEARLLRDCGRLPRPGQVRWRTMRDALPGLAFVGGGTNPRAPGEERTERDITDEPSTTISGPAGNAAPLIVIRTGRSTERAGGCQPYEVGIDVPAPAMRAGGSPMVYLRGQGRAASEPGRLDEPAPTVTTAEEKGTRASPSSGYEFHGGPDRASDAAFLATGRRRLTPEECAALQGFPSDHPFQGTKTAKYRQIGNAVPPALARAVGRAIREASDDAT